MIRFGVLALIWLADMALLSASGPIGAHPVRFAIGFVAGAALMVLMVRTFPIAWPRSKGLGLILLLGLIARISFWSFPPDDDIFRYIWEGYLQQFDINPYVFAPDNPDLFVAAKALPGIRESVNHPELPAAYPPLTLLIFRFLVGISPDPWVFRTAFVLFELATMAILGLVTRSRSVPVSRLLFYAANPLVVVYGAGELHFDVIQVFFLSTALLCFSEQGERSGFLMLGFALMTKYLAVVMLPFFVTARNWKKALLAMVPLVSFLPFADAGLRVFHSLGRFGVHMHYNDGITALIRPLLGPWTPWAAAGLLSLCLLAVLLIEPDPIRGAYLSAACLLVLLPTLHPWYLLLIVPFLVLYPSPAWIYLCAGMAWTFPVQALEWQTGVFQEIHWVKWLEYLPFFGLLLYGCLKEKRPGDRFSYGSVSRISAIVPALNEADRIRTCLGSLRDQAGIQEVIVVDGGSTDETAMVAESEGARVMKTRPGRGHQIRTGISQASGDLILVLHGDSALKAGACRRLLDRVNRRPEAPGGAFEMVFDSKSRKTGLIRRLNRFRAKYLGISFGDQGQFARTAALGQMGGFPDLDLMEDVELSLRLKALGKPLYVENGVTVSGRRWQGRGFSGKFGLVLWLCFRYLLERRFFGPEGVQGSYYSIYYRRHLGRRPG